MERNKGSLSTPSERSRDEPDGASRVEETASHLNSGAVHLLRGMRRTDRESGVSPARLSALSVLVFGGPRSLGRLAETEGVAGPTMTRIVNGLVEIGLARREVHPENGRMAIISATAEGDALMREAAQRRIGVIVRGLATLSPEEQELMRLAAPVLRRLAAIVREETGS